MMNKSIFRVLLAGLIFIAVGCKAASPKVISDKLNQVPRETSGKVTLRILADRRGFSIGVSTGASGIRDKLDFGALLAKEYNILTPEVALKFEVVHPSPDEYDFSAADTIIAFATEHGMGVRGHTLVWSQQLPDWLKQGEWTEDELREILYEHINTVVGHYRGVIVVWDVVNEAMDDNGELADNFWLQGIGPEYVELAFQWAHEADPDARLFYNDNGGEAMNAKADGIYALVADLLERGIPIHGVGMEYHTGLAWAPDPAEVATNMTRLGDLGLEVQITEMDVRIKEPIPEEKIIRQAEVYRGTLTTCLEAPNCTAFVMWGLTDQQSWIPYVYPDWGGALIFADLETPKPAYYAMLAALQEP